MWDWELMNDIKPIWQRPVKEVEEDEYKAFYKTFSRVRLLHVKCIMVLSVFFLAFDFKNESLHTGQRRAPGSHPLHS